MSQPAARVTDMHTCPMFDGPKPHVGGPIIPPCAVTVLTGGLPQARVTDKALCASAPDIIMKGSATVHVNGLMAARMGDMTAHGGVIIVGCPTVLIGDAGGGGGGGGGSSVLNINKNTASGPGEHQNPKGPGGGSASGKLGGDDAAAQAEQLLSRAREAEARVTPTLQELAADSGMTMEGLDYRLKSADSLARKLADTPADLIGDALRYTMISSAETLAKNAANTLATLESSGYKVLRVKNTFKDGAAYKGVNTILMAPNGQKFELQFHTPESFDMKQNRTHAIYEELRVLPPDDPKSEVLSNQMVGMSSTIANPPGLDDSLSAWRK